MAITNASASLAHVMWISRDWRDGNGSRGESTDALTFAAEIGFDQEPPTPAAPWIVRETRTASNTTMQRTNEDMIELSYRHFPTSHDAADWMKENGYR